MREADQQGRPAQHWQCSNGTSTMTPGLADPAKPTLGRELPPGGGPRPVGLGRVSVDRVGAVGAETVRLVGERLVHRLEPGAGAGEEGSAEGDECTGEGFGLL